MLGNRTISGHEIDDNQCAKTVLLQIKEPVERTDENFTTVSGGYQDETDICSYLSQTNLFSFFLTFCVPPIRKQHCGSDCGSEL